MDYNDYIVSWWYNWKVTANHDLPPEDYCTCSTGSCGPQPADKSFVPMVWNIQLMQEDPVEERYPILLGFNEPNHEDQSNIEPEMAAAPPEHGGHEGSANPKNWKSPLHF